MATVPMKSVWAFDYDAPDGAQWVVICPRPGRRALIYQYSTYDMASERTRRAPCKGNPCAILRVDPDGPVRLSLRVGGNSEPLEPMEYSAAMRR